MGEVMTDNIFDQQITFIYVTDLEESRKFYEDVFQFQLVLDQGSCRIVSTIRGGGGYLGYCERKDRVVDSRGIILTLVTTKIDNWFVYLQSRGVEIPEPPKINPDYDIYHFFLHDPDGYTLEIQHFLGSVWENGLSSVSN